MEMYLEHCRLAVHGAVQFPERNAAHPLQSSEAGEMRIYLNASSTKQTSVSFYRSSLSLTEWEFFY